MGAALTRVLLVEDNPADARLVQEMLRDAAPGEFELTRAESLAEAAALARRNKSVIIAEFTCHPAYLSTYLGRPPVETISRLAQTNPDEIGMREVNACLVQLAFSARVLYGLQRGDEPSASPEVAAVVAERLAELAQFVVADLGNCLCASVRATLPRCDYVGVVAQPGNVGTHTAGVTLETLRSSGLDAGRRGIVIVNRAPGITPVNVEEWSNRLGCDVVGVVAPDPDGFYAAELHGRPLVLDQPESIAAGNLSEIATRLAADRVMPMRAS